MRGSYQNKQSTFTKKKLTAMKKQKFFWFSIAMLATCFFILVLAMDGQAKRSYYENLNQEFAETYKKVMDMNKGRFVDLEKIPVGEIIYVPSRWNEKDTEMLELLPPVNGKHDCIYKLVHRYVYGELSPEPKEKTKAEAKLVANDETNQKVADANPLSEKSQSKKLWWLAILPMIPLSIGGRKWWEKKHNPDSYPPVGRNLDTLEEPEIISDIQNVFAEPGAKVLAIQRGTLQRSSGPDKIKVLMKFGDGKDRNVWIRPGESVCKIKVKNFFGTESFKYCRSACTNGMIWDEFQLPKGWEFVPSQNIVVPEVIQTVTETDISKEESSTKAEAEKELPTILIIVSEISFKRPARCTQNKKRCRACKYCKKGRRFCGYKPKPKK
jgi:hypothetical protein